MIPKYDSQNPELLESIVCFADILGFSNLVKKSSSEEQTKILNKLHRILNQQYKELRELNTHGSIKTFTDNIILAYPKFEDGEGQYGSLIVSFMYFQLSMVLNGYFIRGGLALNDYFGDETFAYGPGLVEAYEIESNTANHPRVVLSEKMIDLILEHINEFYGGSDAPQLNEVLLDKEDNLCFINYLCCLEENFQEDGDFDKYCKLILSHKEKVQEAINKNLVNPKIMAKYSWVAKYHNFYCDTFMAPHLNKNDLNKYKIAKLSSGSFGMITDRVLNSNYYGI